jgi:mRNA interferase MazF
MCPVTSSIKSYPFEVVLPAGLPVSRAILSDRVKSLDWRVRKVELIGTLTEEVVSEVMQLGTLLSM